MMLVRRVASLLALGTLAVLGCTFGEQAIPAGVEQPVVHAVLNPTASAQAVLVERTLTGRVSVRDDTLSNPGDPITSGGGVPISGAQVVVMDSTGRSVTAVETRVPAAGNTTRGTGMYTFVNSAIVSRPGSQPALRIVAGARYRLRVTLPDGRVVTGATTVPGTAQGVQPETFAAITFNRDRDTLTLRWNPMPGARAYALRVETPYGAFFLFTDSTAVHLTGDMRNLFADRLPRVFQAGFTQNLYVAAIDTNYFDYYRSGNSPFTGSGIINRLDGGIGMFGAYVPILQRVVFARATDRDPFDGRYVAKAPGGDEALRLWIDTRANGVAEVTGQYALLGVDQQYGALGTLQGDQLHLVAVERSDAQFIFRTIDGHVVGDTLVVQLGGSVPRNDDGRRRFVRQRADTTAKPDSAKG